MEVGHGRHGYRRGGAAARDALLVTSIHTFGVVRSANGEDLLPKELCVFGRTFGRGDEEIVWESVSVGKIFGGVIEGKDVEDDAGVSCCHHCGGRVGMWFQ